MEGAIFKQYIESKGLNKTELAADLLMSKQNLYQLFKSKELQPETIVKIERKFRVKWEKIKQSVNIDVSRNTVSVRNKKTAGAIGSDYLSGKNLDSLYEAHRTVTKNNETLTNTNAELTLAIVRVLPGIRQDQALVPKIVELLQEAFAGKKQMTFDEILKELKKA